MQIRCVTASVTLLSMMQRHEVTKGNRRTTNTIAAEGARQNTQNNIKSPISIVAPHFKQGMFRFRLDVISLSVLQVVIYIVIY
jgi:hypothetical protein